MKCPQCGHWNRASFPRCFRCGAELPVSGAAAPTPAEQLSDAAPGKTYIQINEEGKATPAMDERDRLADEMKDLLARKNRGEEEQRRLRSATAAQGIAPTGRNVQTLDGRSTRFPPVQSTFYVSDAEDREDAPRPDAIPVVSSRTIDYDEFGNEATYRTGRVSGMTARQMRVRHRFGLRRFTRVAAVLLILLCVVAAGYQFVYKPLVRDRQDAPLQERAIITPSIYNDMPAHTVKLPAQEGASIYIKELRKSYTVAGGYATFQVADYIWYENSESVTQEEVTATLTPYIKTSAGEQKPLDVVTYQVEIPLSPLTLVSPDVSYAEVSTALYNIQFEVAKNSTVTINGEDFSDLVNAQNGLISYNATVSPIGENRFTIVTRSQYYRQNSMTITLYREPQDIRLDLAADIAQRWSPLLDEETGKEIAMTVRGTTVTWATINVLSPHRNLDTTQLAVNGSFSFEPVFDHIGTNTIIIEASAPGTAYKTSVVKHNVYYVPIAAVYTRKAWDMDAQYTDFLNFAEKRIANSQIYVCKGTITQIKSEKPQLAIMKLDSTQERTVMIENMSTDKWEVGKKYRVFADAFGLYDGMPRLVGRYTYIQKEK